jgi:quinol monooxygenase YgiN
MLINQGRYTTQEAFLASVQNPEFQRLSQKLTDLGVERTAGLYDSVQSFGGGAG